MYQGLCLFFVVVLKHNARRERTYLALGAIILPLLNEECIWQSLFHSAVVICCVILET